MVFTHSTAEQFEVLGNDCGNKPQVTSNDSSNRTTSTYINKQHWKTKQAHWEYTINHRIWRDILIEAIWEWNLRGDMKRGMIYIPDLLYQKWLQVTYSSWISRTTLSLMAVTELHLHTSTAKQTQLIENSELVVESEDDLKWHIWNSNRSSEIEIWEVKRAKIYLIHCIRNGFRLLTLNPRTTIYFR